MFRLIKSLVVVVLTEDVVSSVKLSVESQSSCARLVKVCIVVALREV